MNLLANPSFEAGWDGSWLIYPSDRANFAVLADGEGMYPDDAAFAAYDGSMGIKIYGVYNGDATETPIYQEFPASEGQSYTLEGWTYMHGPDAIDNTRTYGNIWLKFFDDSYNFYGITESAGSITVMSTTDAWTQLTVTDVVPTGATKVQAGFGFWHCQGETADCYDGGGVYFDDMLFYLNAE